MSELKEALDNGKFLDVTFTKVNGTKRKMYCCKTPDLVGEEHTYSGRLTTRNLDGIIVVWDIENEGFRSFREDSVVSWSIAE